MGIIQNIIRKVKEKKAEKEQYENRQKIIEGYETRKLDSNERELLRYREEARKARIKKELETIRKRKNDELWSGHLGNPVDAPNVTANHKEIFKNGEKLFKDKSEIFGGKSIFFK